MLSSGPISQGLPAVLGGAPAEPGRVVPSPLPSLKAYRLSRETSWATSFASRTCVRAQLWCSTLQPCGQQPA